MQPHIGHARALAGLGLSLLITPMSIAWAQSPAWPAKPVRLVVGFAAGGPTDVVARGFAEQATKGLGQAVVVDNKPGANTIIAAEAVAGATDGHTLLMAATNHTMIPALYSARIKFDAVRSFKPVCRLASAPTVLVVGPALPVRSLGEFVERAKATPMALTYATPGIGSSVHFASELFARQAAVKLTHVPYKGAAPAVADVMGGQVDASFATLGSVLPLIKSGKLTALALASPQRSAQLPGVPTFAEAGFKDYAADAWYGLMAPANTPDPVMALLQREARAYATSAAGAEKLGSLGMEAQVQCGDAFANDVARESAVWTQIAQQLKLKVD